MGAKIETQKSPWSKKYPPKYLMPNFRALTSLDVFFRRTTRPRYAGTNTNLRLFQIPYKKPYLNQTAQKYTRQIFLPKKNPELKISNPNKSVDHPRHLKSGVRLLSARPLTLINNHERKTHAYSRKPLH